MYGQHPHLLGDVNKALLNDATPEGHDERLKLLQSARKEAVIASYERAARDKDSRDEIVTPHELDEGEWVLVRHETPQKFESKWYGPYQIIQRMMLGTYRLQDPNGRELAALVHGNRLVKATIRTADELRDLWASPSGKDALRKRNVQTELIPSYPENTNALDRFLLEDEDVPPVVHETARDPAIIDEQDRPLRIKINLKRLREQEVVGEVATAKRIRATPSSST